MPPVQGRLEKRIRRAVPVQIVGMERQDAERTTTENVCSRGVRVVARRPLKPGERLLLISPSGDERAEVRVIYCERLADGRFAAGLLFQNEPIGWAKAVLVADPDDAKGSTDSN